MAVPETSFVLRAAVRQEKTAALKNNTKQQHQKNQQNKQTKNLKCQPK